MTAESPQAVWTVSVALTETQYQLCHRLAELNGMSVAQIIEAAAEKGLQTLAAEVLRDAESRSRAP